MSFSEKLQAGKVGEGKIAQWLIGRGWSVLPVYEKEMDVGKGPVLYSAIANLIAPDMLTFRRTQVRWVEAKTKTSFSWYRIKRHWVTGIDLRHYEHYKRLAASSPWQIWLMFLHLDSQGAKDTPPEHVGHSPVGLFGQELLWLSRHESHQHQNGGKAGMVYWAHGRLQLLAPVHEVDCSALPTRRVQDEEPAKGPEPLRGPAQQSLF